MIFLPKGEELVTVSFKGWTIGLLICADFGFSELAKSLALKKNADVIMYPSAWNPGLGLPVFRMQQYKSSRKPGLYGWIKQGIRGRGVLW